MPKKQKETFLMWSNTEEYRKRIVIAKENIRNILIDYHPIVLFSGGKDSLVLLHMVMQQDNNVPVYYNDAGYDYKSQQIKMPASMTMEIIEIGKETGARYIYSCGHKNPNSKRFFGNLFNIMKKHSCDVELLGLRKEESIGRKNRIGNNLIKTEGIRKMAFPLRDFTWMDIWAYIISNNIRYLSYYDKYAVVEGYDKVRLSSRFSRGLLHKGGSLYLDCVLMPEFRNEQPKRNV